MSQNKHMHHSSALANAPFARLLRLRWPIEGPRPDGRVGKQAARPAPAVEGFLPNPPDNKMRHSPIFLSCGGSLRARALMRTKPSIAEQCAWRLRENI